MVNQSSSAVKQSTKTVKGINTNQQMPSLSQFMNLIKSEKSALASSPSGYNVYNKYDKTS